MSIHIFQEIIQRSRKDPGSHRISCTLIVYCLKLPQITSQKNILYVPITHTHTLFLLLIYLPFFARVQFHYMEKCNPYTHKSHLYLQRKIYILFSLLIMMNEFTLSCLPSCLSNIHTRSITYQKKKRIFTFHVHVTVTIYLEGKNMYISINHI